MFFDSWAGLGRTVIVGICAYVALVLLVRISGKRTLSKMNAFDLIVTVALGSTLATVLLSKDIPLAEGILAFGVLISLQFVIAWLSVRSAKVRSLVKSEPALLYFQGDFLRGAMVSERVTEGEVLAAVRSQGIASMAEAEAVVLETDGSFTALRRSGEGRKSTLRGVKGFEDADGQTEDTNSTR